jgi:ubiquinone biosynthesis protein
LIQRILVATDRSDTATRAVEWAPEMADRYAAELLVLQVVAPEHVVGGGENDRAGDLAMLAERLAGARGRARVEYDPEPAETIVTVAAQEDADIVVVGNRSMSDRTEFLLGSVPNRVSHTAPCTVVIVNTVTGSVTSRQAETDAETEVSDGQLLGRAARIAAVVGKYGLGNLLSLGGEAGAPDEARAAVPSGPRGARADVRQARPDPLDAP